MCPKKDKKSRLVSVTMRELEPTDLPTEGRFGEGRFGEDGLDRFGDLNLAFGPAPSVVETLVVVAVALAMGVVVGCYLISQRPKPGLRLLERPDARFGPPETRRTTSDKNHFDIVLYA